MTEQEYSGQEMPGDTPNTSAPKPSLPDEAPTQAVSLAPDDPTAPFDSSFASYLEADEKTEFPDAAEDEIIHYIEEEPEETAKRTSKGRMYKHRVEKRKRPQKPEKKAPPLPYFKGLLHRMDDRFGKQSAAARAAYFGICALLFVLLFLCASLMAAAYLTVILALLFIALCLCLLCLFLIVAGLTGLAGGIVMLFQNTIAAALIEIGLSTMFFGIIYALSALCYELVSVKLPRLIRYLTRLFLYVILLLLTYVFGSEKFAPKQDPKQEVFNA